MKMKYSTWHEHETKKNSESPTGIEPMASQIPVGRSNQLSYERLVVSWAILILFFGLFSYRNIKVHARDSQWIVFGIVDK